jgi:hypothetical protein
MIDEQRFLRHLGVLALVLLAWILFILTKSLYAWAVIPFFVIGAMLIGNPLALLWVGLGWFMIVQYVGTEFRVGFLGYVDEAVTVAMLLVTLIAGRKFLRSSGQSGEVRFLQPVAVAFFLLAVLSTAINGSFNIYLLMWCFQYLRMFVVILFAAAFVTDKEPRRFFWFLMVTAAVEFALNIGWKLRINPLPNVKKYELSDFGVGTLGGCDSVAYFCVMIAILCLAILMDPPGPKAKKTALIVLLLTMANFMLTNTNHAYFILAAAIGVLFLVNKRMIKKIISIPLLMAGGGVVAVFFLLFSMTDAGFSLSPDYLKKRYELFMAGTKVTAYVRNATELPKESTYFWLTGLGPGQAGSCIGSALRRPMAEKYFNVLYNEEKYRQDVKDGSITTGPNTGILTYWSELGPPGIFLLVLVYYKALRKSGRLRKSDRVTDKYQLAFIRTLPSVFTTMLAIALLRDLFYIAWLIGTVWIWAVLAMIPLGIKPLAAGPETGALPQTPVNRWQSMNSRSPQKP